MPIYTYQIYTELDEPTGITFDDFFNIGDAPELIQFEDGTHAKKYVQPFGLQKFSSSFDTEFPYFDRGLGRQITSASHRAEVCKELGVVPLDGDIDNSDEQAEYNKKVEEEDAIVEDMRDRLLNHPGYAEYRRLRDMGWKPKQKIQKRGTIHYNEGA
jgi:hypothetical protein|tara:strand:+ start:573 stop:1043 length:471 start_codon:yes stop_codon:yes gene_type:complete